MAAQQPGRGALRKESGQEPASDIPTTEMVRKSTFWIFYIWIALLTASGLMLVSLGERIAAEVGTTLSGNNIATAVGMISILNAVGRICTGLSMTASATGSPCSWSWFSDFGGHDDWPSRPACLPWS